MWLTIFIFLLITSVIAWSFFGYFITIFFIGLFKVKKMPAIPDSLPRVSLIVPCYNEIGQILAKLDNIRSLDYPRELMEVVFVDGDSSDETVLFLKKEIKPEEKYNIIVSDKRGKINQLNHVLPGVKSDIVVVSDVDALLSRDTFKWIAAEFFCNPDISVVGAYCHPSDGLAEDSYYWDSQNKGRLMETDAMSSSIVVAPCYAFKRRLLERFPEDVVADDVYIAFLAHSLCRRVIYSRLAKIIETRSPQSYTDFIAHKFRKSNAVLKESLRFLYLLPEMNFFCKVMFVTRITQQIFLPIALIFWLLMAGGILTMFRYDIVILTIVTMAILFISTSAIFSAIKLPDDTRRYSILTVIRGYFLTLAIMLATGISYPFVRQNSSYPRLNTNKTTV